LINFHPHLYFLVTEGGMDADGVFHIIPRIDDARLAEIFAREVPADLVRKELLSPEWAERILSWWHTGLNVHSLVRAKTKAVRVGRYTDITDSFHIYGSYFKEFQGFLKLVDKRSFEERTWPSSYAEPMFREAREKLEKEKSGIRSDSPPRPAD